MKDTPSAEASATDGDADSAAPIQAVVEALRGLRFGSVTVIVQDGVIVQVERLEKKRLGRSARTE